MTAAIKRIWVLIIGFFRKGDEQKEERHRRKYSEEDKEFFTFRRTVLDELSVYFGILRRMKKGDPEAYKLYSKRGAFLVPGNRFYLEHQNLPASWNEVRPTFGAIAFGCSPEMLSYAGNNGEWTPKLIYFRKYERRKQPPEIQRGIKGDVYALTVYWDDLLDKRMKKGVPTEFPVVVRPDGEVVVLRVLQRETQSVRATKGKERGKKFDVPKNHWGVPDFFKRWAADHNEGVHEYLKTLFIMTASAYEAARADMARIKVHKGSMAAIFHIDVLKTPYFFKDRQGVLTEAGKKRPIFHIVRAHKRTLADGSELSIRTHFSGEREFLWNGYRVSISVDGWHHADLTEFNVGLHDIENADDDASYVLEEELADRFNEYERAGVAGYATSKRRRRARRKMTMQ